MLNVNVGAGAAVLVSTGFCEPKAKPVLPVVDWPNVNVPPDFSAGFASALVPNRADEAGG